MSADAERRRVATDAEVAAALHDLDGDPTRTPVIDWPPLEGLELPGLYSWWTDVGGAVDLSDGLGIAVQAGQIYAGQAGATKWPSGKVGGATLGSRIGSNHVRGRIRGSTFRLTLASALAPALELLTVGPKKLAPESETRLSAWMAEHLEVAVHPFADRDALGDLESKVLDVLDPPLNLEGRPLTPTRKSLKKLRAVVASATDAEVVASAPAAPARSPADTVERAMATGGSRVTLHEEIAAILRDHGGSMTTQEIADAANERGNYVKKDGSPITAFQIHGRTKNYPQLFDRDGARVRLSEASG